jgi:hypothetical protein
MAVDRWFRFYESAITHDKVRLLPSDTLRWQWVILLAVASKYGGAIPSLNVAAINLNVKEPKAAQIIAALHRAELLDVVEGGYFKPHDWNDRQPIDATAAIRMQRYRERQKKERNGGAVTTVTPAVTVTPTEIRGKSKKEDDDDAGARPPLISAEANKLADECAKIAGHDLSFIPPSWYGSAYRAQTWLNEGWPEEIILLSVREQSARKRDGPPSKIDYFEKGIAAAIARANAPLPVATITEIPRNRHAADQSKSGYAAIDRVFDRPEMRPAIGQAADENTVLSLPAGSIQRS